MHKCRNNKKSIQTLPHNDFLAILAMAAYIDNIGMFLHLYRTYVC